MVGIGMRANRVRDRAGEDKHTELNETTVTHTHTGELVMTLHTLMYTHKRACMVTYHTHTHKILCGHILHTQ